jgi:hypothetical protein
MNSPRKYTSSASFFVFSENGKTSGLGGYASLLGVSLPSDFNTYIEPLFKSKRLEHRVFLILSRQYPQLIPDPKTGKAKLRFIPPTIKMDDKTRVFTVTSTYSSPAFAQLVLQTYINEINTLNLELELSPKKEIITVLDAPSLPKHPTSPKPARNLVVGVILGAFVGVLIPFLTLIWKEIKHESE